MVLYMGLPTQNTGSYAVQEAMGATAPSAYEYSLTRER